MKIKHLFFAAAVAAMGLASCSKTNEGGPDLDGSSDMLIRFGIDTRADAGMVDPNIVGDVYTKFNSGAIFFANGDTDETIVRTVEITPNSQAGKVTPQQLQDGVLFEDIANTAVKVYVVGNYDFNGATYPNMKAVRQVATTVLDQADDTDWGVNNVTLFGGGDIVAASAATKAKEPKADKEAIFTIYPIAARLEITSVKGEGENGEDMKYKLKGIFINNFYYDMSIAGIPVSDVKHFSLPNHTPLQTGDWDTRFAQYLRTNEVNNDWETNVATGISNGQYDNAWYEVLFDDGDWVDDTDPTQGVNGLSMTVGKTHTPANGAWAYNVFAHASNNANIILHFVDMEIEDAPAGSGTYTKVTNAVTNTDGEKFLTVTGYTIKGGGSTTLAGGNIYRMDIEFTDKVLGDTPYPGDEDDRDANIWVEVTVQPWVVNLVDPEYN